MLDEHSTPAERYGIDEDEEEEEVGTNTNPSNVQSKKVGNIQNQGTLVRNAVINQEIELGLFDMCEEVLGWPTEDMQNDIFDKQVAEEEAKMMAELKKQKEEEEEKKKRGSAMQRYMQQQ
ncbi:MAG: hypothetical protein EZS28_032629, partial [Streblomastix strix]